MFSLEELNHSRKSLCCLAAARRLARAGPTCNHGQTMNVTFDLTREDMLEFMRQHHTHSPSSRRTVATFRYSLTALLGGGGAGLGWFMGLAPWLYLPVGVIGAGVYFAMFPRFWRQNIERQTEKMLAEGQNRGLLGRQEVEVSDEGVAERNTHGELRARWSTVERVRVTRAQILVYTSSVQAIVVPRRALAEGEDEQLIEALEQGWAEAAGPSAPVIERV
jgi:hypothetical protein